MSDSSNEALLLVGRIGRAHGIRGQVAVNPETDFMEDRFKVGRILRVGPAERTREYEIRDVRFHKGRPIVQFAGIDTMNQAEALAGAELWVPEAALAPELPSLIIVLLDCLSNRRLSRRAEHAAEVVRHHDVVATEIADRRVAEGEQRRVDPVP